MARQRSRVRWLREGDANSKLFHAIANGRRTKNFIPSIRVGNVTITDQDDKVHAFTEAYASLLGEVHNRQHTVDLEAIGIQPADLHELEAVFSEEEVWSTIKEMPADRAPGPDGFMGEFYRRAWPIIKHDIMACLLKLAVGDGRGFARLNRALITLIPKKTEAVEVRDYRPISLVHSFSKLFSKLIANRLRGRLGDVGSSNQSAFVRGRCLHNNFLLVRQVARRINARRQTGILLKLDLTCAFDTMSWGFLFEVLRKMGFGPLFLKWISLLLNTANTKVTVNGVPGASFRHASGLRQGDPTSPMLFVAAMQVLTALMEKAVEQGLVSNLAGISALQRISIYADDVVLFLKPITHEINVIKQILATFGEASGLQVNYAKTSATVIRGTAEDETRIGEQLGCACVPFPIRYLGLQLALRPLTRAGWQPLLDSAVKLVPSWQRGFIQRAGRLVLIKTVMTARPIHHIMVDGPPAWVVEEINKHLRSFFWVGNKEATGGNCLVAWDSVCKPLCYGGLGVKNLRLQSLASESVGSGYNARTPVDRGRV
jgi:hypothetical protein